MDSGWLLVTKCFLSSRTDGIRSVTSLQGFGDCFFLLLSFSPYLYPFSPKHPTNTLSSSATLQESFLSGLPFLPHLDGVLDRITRRAMCTALEQSLREKKKTLCF